MNPEPDKADQEGEERVTFPQFNVYRFTDGPVGKEVSKWHVTTDLDYRHPHAEHLITPTLTPNCEPQEACPTCGSDDPTHSYRVSVGPAPVTTYRAGQCPDPFHTPPQEEERLYCSKCGEARGTDDYTCRDGGKSVPLQEADDRKQVDAVRSWTLRHTEAHGGQELTGARGPGLKWGDEIEVVPASELARVQALYEQAQETIADLIDRKDRQQDRANQAEEDLKQAKSGLGGLHEWAAMVKLYREAEAERDAALAKLKRVDPDAR